jgi:ParB family chromosome partitioning protein
MLADRHDVALAALAHTLAQSVFYATGDDSGFALHVVTPPLRAEGIEDSKAMKHGGEQHAAWQSRLPEDEAALWDWLLAQDTATVTGLLAYCVACTVKPVRSGGSRPWRAIWGASRNRSSSRPVTEGKSAKAAENIAALKKGDMAARAAELLAETSWLPAMLRAA